MQNIIKQISRDPFANFLGIALIEVKEGYSKAVMMLKDDMLNFHGVAHGGAVFSLADFAFSAASNSYGQVAVALSMEINYRRAVEAGTRLIAEAKEESLGKRTGLYHIAVTTENGELVASCHGTVYRKEKQII